MTVRRPTSRHLLVRFPVLLAIAVCWIIAASPPAAAQCAAPDLSGRWAMILVMPAVADLPFLGQISLITETAAFVDVVQSGSTVLMLDDYCFVNVEMTPPLIVSSIPEAFIRSLQPTTRTALLVQSGAQVAFIQDWYTEVRGAHLADPVGDPLPVSPFDERVFDQDGDGHPGLTIPVNALDLVSGDTYVVHRLRYRLVGTVLDDRTIVGSIPQWSSEQTVIGATDAILMLPFSYAHHPDRSLHRFVMVRVDDSWNCETLRSATEEILENE